MTGMVDIASDMAAAQVRIAQIIGADVAAQPLPTVEALPAASFSSYLDDLMHLQPPATPMQMPVNGAITSPFGERQNPIGEGTEFHPGVDIAADEGAPIQAAMAGTVVAVGRDGGYGNLITVDDGNGLTTRYAHCSQIYARIGQQIQPGDVIGAVGMTGRATGPHLHFEVRQNDQPVDPMQYLH